MADFAIVDGGRIVCGGRDQYSGIATVNVIYPAKLIQSGARIALDVRKQMASLNMLKCF